MSAPVRGGQTAHRDDNGLVLVLAVGGIVVSLSQTLVIPLLALLPSILGTSAVNASWVVTITLLAGAVALSAFVPVLLYTYVNVPAIGPIPSMYDPFWTTPKVVSAVAEGLGAVLAGVGVWLSSGVRDVRPG